MIGWVASFVALLALLQNLLPFADINLPIPRLPLPWVLAIFLGCAFIVALIGGHRRAMDEREKYTDIGGPALFIGWEHIEYSDPPLVIQNSKGTIAYNVVVKIPEDGSKFESKILNILQDNGRPALCQFGENNKLVVADLILADAAKLPVVVTCMDADCREFVYHFTQPDRPGLGFKLASKRCTGRVFTS